MILINLYKNEYKICNGCKQHKHKNEYAPSCFIYGRCKSCHKQYNIEHKEEKRLYDKEHKEEKRLYDKEHKEEKRLYDKEHKEERRQYQEKNKEKIKLRRKEYGKKKKQEEEQKQKGKEYRRKYYQEHKKTLKKQQKKYRQGHEKEIKLRSKKHYKENKEKIRISQNKYIRERYKNDPVFRCKRLVSNTVYMALKNCRLFKNKSSCSDYLGNDYFVILSSHIEGLFESWMNWKNQGIYNAKTWDDKDPSTWTWQLDHVIPHADLSYDSMDHPNFKKCWALENLRPLNSKQNYEEGINRTRHNAC